MGPRVGSPVPVVAGLSSDDDAAFARSLGDWRDSCQTAQGGVVTSLQRIEGFCEQRGEDDPSYSRQGCEDLHVMLLPLPRLGLLGRDQAGGKGIEPVMCVLELPVHQADARNERGDVGAGGFGRTGGDLHGRLAQYVEHMGGVEAAYAIALEKLGDRRLVDTRGFVGRRHGLPQIEQPLRSEIVFELEDRWKIAPQLLSQAICQAIALSAEILGGHAFSPFEHTSHRDLRRSLYW